MLATTTPAAGRSIKARRIAADALLSIADLLHHLLFIAIIALAVTTIGAIGPAWAQLTETGFAAAALALYGASCVIGEIATSLSHTINPDTTDGDPAYLAATVLHGLATDLDNGADRSEVLTSVQDSRVVRHMGDVLLSLALEARTSGRTETADALGTAADHVHQAAYELGTKQI